MRRTRFLREIGGVALLVVVTVVLTLYLTPERVSVRTEAVAVAPEPPAYAQRYMDAFCGNNGEYLVQHTSGAAASAQSILIAAERAVQAGRGCRDVQYLGRYRTQDAHVFTAVFEPSGREDFVILTFDDARMLVSLE